LIKGLTTHSRQKLQDRLYRQNRGTDAPSFQTNTTGYSLLLVSLVPSDCLVTRAWPLYRFETRYFLTKSWYCWLDYSTPRPLRTQWHLGRLLQRIVMPKARADILRKKCMGAPTFHHPPAKVTRLGSSRVDFFHGFTGHNFYGSQLHLGNLLAGRCRVPLESAYEPRCQYID
jgi:hypothetical protein